MMTASARYPLMKWNTQIFLAGDWLTSNTSSNWLTHYGNLSASSSFHRYLVAARDLLTSEIIIQQSPLVIGPIANDENAPVCLNCYQALEIEDSFRYVHQQFVSIFENLFYDLYFLVLNISSCYARCPDCKFPLCSARCQGRYHTKIECQFLKVRNVQQYLHWQAHRSELQHDYEAITILR